jgi:3-hydroxypropanoate dehydrogenase
VARILNDEGLDTLFRAARSPQFWLPEPVNDTILEALAGLVQLAPVDGSRLRLVFARTTVAKSQLATALRPEDRETVVEAPIAALLSGFGCDGSRNVGGRESVAAAYLIFAARSLGLDCTPFWEFDRQAVGALLFPENDASPGFLCALGYGDDNRVMPAEKSPCRGSLYRAV